MLPGLEPCIARYYDVWLSYSRYICAQYGVLNEACDVVGDVMGGFMPKIRRSISRLSP